jgi:hypothetical protein
MAEKERLEEQIGEVLGLDGCSKSSGGIICKRAVGERRTEK